MFNYFAAILPGQRLPYHCSGYDDFTLKSYTAIIACKCSIYQWWICYIIKQNALAELGELWPAIKSNVELMMPIQATLQNVNMLAAWW